MIIMIGATVVTLALMPLVVGLLSAFVAYGRQPRKEALSGKIKR